MNEDEPGVGHNTVLYAASAPAAISGPACVHRGNQEAWFSTTMSSYSNYISAHALMLCKTGCNSFVDLLQRTLAVQNMYTQPHTALDVYKAAAGSMHRAIVVQAHLK